MRVYIVLLFFVAFIAQGKAEGESKDLCPEGWIQLTDTCGLDGDDVCVKVGQPLKFVSWLHLQFMCDAAGGYLPELTAANKGELDLILSSYDQLYGATLLYLGATDITHTDDWKWLNSRKPLKNKNWGKDLPSKNENKDCLAQSSETKLWENIDCEDQNIQTQVAFVCMRKKSDGNLTPSCTNPKLVRPDMITCSASSTLKRKTEKTACKLVFDGDSRCITNSGIWTTTGDGTQSWIKAQFSQSITITQIKIKQRNNRDHQIKAIEAVLDGNKKMRYAFKSRGCTDWEVINLGAPQQTNTMKINIISVYGGSTHPGFAEIEVYGCY